MLFIGIFLVNVTKASAYPFFLHAAITWGTQAYDKKKKNVARIVNSVLDLNYFSFL